MLYIFIIVRWVGDHVKDSEEDGFQMNLKNNSLFHITIPFHVTIHPPAVLIAPSVL